MTIKINNENIRIRPSSIDGFFGCSYQWGKTFLEGVVTIPNARAAIGTSIHAAAEHLWKDAMKTGKKDTNLSTLSDVAMDTWKETVKEGVQFDEGEDENSAAATILGGTGAYVDDIVPFAQIPTGVEEFFKIDVDHPIVSEVGGTVDYITDTSIADIKTSKRKPTVGNYLTQQSMYTMLANANGRKVEHNLIQSVVLKKQPDGAILPMESKPEYAKNLVNHMLDTLDLVAKDVAPIETILRGNPKYMFCSNKYCSLYDSCPFVQGKDLNKIQVQNGPPIKEIKL